MADGQGEDLSYKAWEPTIKRLARSVMFRMGAAGTKVDFDDAVQIVAERWCRCVQQFDTEKGEFSHYFHRAVKNDVSLKVTRSNRNRAVNALSLDNTLADDGDDTFMSTIYDPDALNPEEILIRKTAINRMKDKAPLLHRMIELVREEPEELMEELQAVASQEAYAQSLGAQHHADAPTALTPEVLVKIFGMNWRYKSRINVEIMETARDVG